LYAYAADLALLKSRLRCCDAEIAFSDNAHTNANFVCGLIEKRSDRIEREKITRFCIMGAVKFIGGLAGRADF
jgi:hypothetical protein